MRLWIFEDYARNSERVRAAAIKRGHEVVRQINQAEAGFVRLHTIEPWRRNGLAAIRDLHRAGVPTLPAFADSLWYDDKLVQRELLRPWLPETVIVHPGDDMPNMTLPFVSKASTGAGSRNVRLIRTRDEAQAEYDAAFGDGIPLAPEGVQQGYLYWQRLVPDNAGDIRVVVTGDFMFGLRRHNRPDRPFASGSGSFDVIASLDDAEVAAAFRLCDEIARALPTRWQCFDVVFDGARPLCLEMASSWTVGSYKDCPLFNRDTWALDGRTAAEWAAVAVEELERLCASPS